MHIEQFNSAEALPLVEMWRASFEFGVGVRDPHPIEAQVSYLFEHLAPSHSLRVAKDGKVIVGFLASSSASIGALYVRVQNIGHGIGSELLRLAQSESSGSLWLHTFAQNHRARRFYAHHAFVEREHGFESTWQLEDVKLTWSRPPGEA